MRDLIGNRRSLAGQLSASDGHEAFVVDAKAGDEVAFRRLVEHYRSDLLVLCRSLCRRSADVDDAYQESLKALWQGLAAFEGRNGAQLSTWLFRVSTNAVNSMYRRRVPEPMAPNEFLTRPVMTDVAQTATDNESVRQALNQLPDNFRAALVLADVIGLPYREIAKMQYVSESTVKSRVFRARQAMRVLLGGSKHA